MPPGLVVDLRGRLGPLARSKRLRMVRTQRTSDERGLRAAGGRRPPHTPWVLGPTSPRPTTGSRLVMRLRYGGALWGPVLERLLGDEIEQPAAPARLPR